MLSAIPKTLQELSSALAEANGETKAVAGGTDLVIRQRRGDIAPDGLIYLGVIPELREITFSEEAVRVGAMVTMRDLAAAFAGEGAYRAIADAAAGMGTPQIRNKATLGGNLCTASPAGDMLPVAWLYGAQVEILDGMGRTACLPVQEFLLGPGKTALQPSQAVTAVIFPRPKAGISAFCKIGYRENASIARESLAGLFCLDGEKRITGASLVLGAVGGTPIRAAEAEQYLIGREWSGNLEEQVTSMIARTVHDHCRPAHRLYKTEAARGLSAQLWSLLLERG